MIRGVQINNLKRIFISSFRSELRFVRQVQLILEEQYDYQTYIHELPEFEAQPRNDQGLYDKAVQSRNDEIEHLNEIMYVVSSQMRRNIFRENSFVVPDHMQAVYWLDIDDAWELERESLDSYLCEAINQAFAGQKSNLWDAVPSSYEEFPPREQRCFKYAHDLFQNYSDDLALKILQATSAEVVGFTHQLELLGHTFNNKRLEDMSMIEFVLGRVVDFWNDRDENLQYIKSQKRKRYDRVLLKEFHMYPPFQPKGTAFISHSSRNLIQVRHLQLLLEYKGYRTFVFRLGQLEGREFHSPDVVADLLVNLENQIKAADIVVAASSPHFRLSPWTFAELALAQRYEKPVYQIDLSFGDYHQREYDLNMQLQNVFNSKMAAKDLPSVGHFPHMKYILVASSFTDKFHTMSDDEITRFIQKMAIQYDDNDSAIVQVFIRITNYRYELNRDEIKRLWRILAYVTPDNAFSKLIMQDIDYVVDHISL